MHLPAALPLMPGAEPAAPSGFASATGTLSCCGVVLDFGRRRGFAGGRDLGLSPAEFAMLQLLFMRRGVAMSKEAISAGLPVQVDPRMIDVYICRARAKLAAYGMEAAIVTVPGRGYMAGGSEDGAEDLGPAGPPVSSDLDVALAP